MRRASRWRARNKKADVVAGQGVLQGKLTLGDSRVRVDQHMVRPKKSAAEAAPLSGDMMWFGYGPGADRKRGPGSAFRGACAQSIFLR
jgi:hypothetical protein